MPDMWNGVNSLRQRRVFIERCAIETIIRESYRTVYDGLETGGILLGHDAAPDAASSLSVTTAGTPGPKALREPDRFLRDLHFSTALAADAWRTDRSQWIGDWHTHRSGSPTPSPTDMRSYQMLLLDDELAFQQFVTIVVVPGPATSQPTLGTWVIKRDSAARAGLAVRGTTSISRLDRKDPPS